MEIKWLLLNELRHVLTITDECVFARCIYWRMKVRRFEVVHFQQRDGRQWLLQHCLEVVFVWMLRVVHAREMCPVALVRLVWREFRNFLMTPGLTARVAERILLIDLVTPFFFVFLSGQFLVGLTNESNNWRTTIISLISNNLEVSAVMSLLQFLR